MKVSYQSEWNKEGYTYTQTIRMRMSKKSLELINDACVNFAKKFKHGDVFMGHVMEPMNIKKPIFVGKNYLTISQLFALYHIYDWKEEKRVKLDRNTIFLVEIE